MLAQRFFRSAFARTQRFYYRSPWPTRIPRTAYRWQRPGHIHQRAFRAINHRHLINSWNTLRVWVQEPLFYYNVAGITLLCGLFYAYYLERVPVGHQYLTCESSPNNYDHLDIKSLTFQHDL